MKPRRYPILVLLLCSFTNSFAQTSKRTEHFLKIEPLSIAERHFGCGIGAGYELVTGRNNKLSVSLPFNFYHGIFVQIGKPAALYPDVKSRYATFSPTFSYLPVHNNRFSYGIGIGMQIMYAYGTRVLRAEGINPFPEYIPVHYKAFRLGSFVHNQFAARMGKGNNRFTLDMGLGMPFYDKLPDSKSPVLVRFNLGFAFAL